MKEEKIMSKYKALYFPSHHRATKDGYVYEHILIAEQKLGRLLNDGEVVHHIDENKMNNSIDNLIVFKTLADHTSYHKGSNIFLEGDVYVAEKKCSDKCPICGNKKYIKSKMCSNCNKNEKSKSIPPKEELEQYLPNVNFTFLGNKYKVSCNAVKKWFKKYNLPYTKKMIKEY